MALLVRSEEMVMLAVWQLKDNAYGVTIRRYLEETTGENFSFASIYVPLDRLTEKGFLEAVDVAPTKERGGRRKRLFKLTKAGIEILTETQRVNATLWEGFQGLQTGSSK